MVKICTYNTRGLRDFSKRKQLYALLKHKNLDVVLLQETHAIDMEINLWRSQWGGEIMYANGTSQSKGVIILIKRGLNYRKISESRDPCGRYVISEIEIENLQFVLCNLYAPNVNSPGFFSKIRYEIEQLDNRNVIIGGD